MKAELAGYSHCKIRYRSKSLSGGSRVVSTSLTVSGRTCYFKRFFDDVADNSYLVFLFSPFDPGRRSARVFTVPFPPAIFGRPVFCRIRRAYKVDIGRPVVPREVRTVAICAGSGGSVLDGVDADVYLTGEMSHVRFFWSSVSSLLRACACARDCFCHVVIVCTDLPTT